MAPAIAALGELLVEFVAEDKGTGHLAPSRYAGPFASGAPAIFIDQAARMGTRALMAGAVGADAFGEVVLGRLRRGGVDVSPVELRGDLPTGIVFVAYDATGGRDFVYTIAASAAPHVPSRADAGARSMALKRGAAGASAMDASGVAEVSGHAVTEVDPTGAGDCFGATFVASLLQGAPLAAAMAWANAAGALAVTRLGPIEGNSTEAELRAVLDRR